MNFVEKIQLFRTVPFSRLSEFIYCVKPEKINVESRQRGHQQSFVTVIEALICIIA